MSRKHSRLSSDFDADHQHAALDNINTATLVDGAGGSTTEHPRKRKKVNKSQSILLKQVQDHKDLLFVEYQNNLRKKKEEDKAWKWLSGHGIPCHNMPIPVTPHTKAYLQKGCLTTEDALKGINLNDVYHAHDITRAIVARYCDWKFSDSLPPIGAELVNNVFVTYRNAARKAIFGASPPRPDYAERPTRHDSEKAIERYILRVLRSAAVIFKDPKLRIPLEWTKIPLPKPLGLPSSYTQILTEMETNEGRTPEVDEEDHFDREPSRPLDEIEGSPLMDLLKSSIYSDDPVTASEQQKLELLQEAFPIGDTVTRETAYENAQEARKMVNDLNHPHSLNTSRRELANKLDADNYKRSVQFVDAKEIRHLDDSGFGSVLFNNEPTNLSHQTANIALKWANETGSPPSATETGHEKDVGGLLNKIVISEEIYVSDNGTLSLPACLQIACMQPQPDLFSQAPKIASCPRLSPVLFAGECKTKKGLTPHASAQLACALNGTLVLLVIMYLDIRSTTEEPLPEWLFVYGIIYTGSGVIIRAHFPTYRYAGDESDTDPDGEYEPQSLVTGRRTKAKKAAKAKKDIQDNKAVGASKGGMQSPQDGVPALTIQKQRAVNHGAPRWMFRSVEVSRRYLFAFESRDGNERMRLLATLLMIRSHSLLLLEKFKTWAVNSSTSQAFAEFLSVLNPI